MKRNARILKSPNIKLNYGDITLFLKMSDTEMKKGTFGNNTPFSKCKRIVRDNRVQKNHINVKKRFLTDLPNPRSGTKGRGEGKNKKQKE